MKKRFLIALSALFVFSMVAAAFAYTRTNASAQNRMENCPMQRQNASANGERKDSCCGMADCCKDGKCSMGGACCKTDKENCPMKQSAKNDSGEMNMQNVTFVKSEGGDCCGKHKQS